MCVCPTGRGCHWLDIYIKDMIIQESIYIYT